MPELPEVETLCRQLHARIAGKEIVATRVYDGKLAGLRNLGGRVIRLVERRGKSIVISLDDGEVIIIHLRMTGRLLWHEDKKREAHTRWRMTLTNGNVDLIDVRRFATVTIAPLKPDRGGNDLLTGFDEKAFLRRQAGRSVSVKVLLMDPKAVAGIGNIYVCEILHRGGISPVRPATTLGEKEWQRLFRVAERILKKGIEKRGTSISDWRDLYGCPGENQNELKVYGRGGKACYTCGEMIIRMKQSGRSTFYCPQCQK